MTISLKTTSLFSLKQLIHFSKLFPQVQVGIQPELIHFIGHSLGAHMAAYTGQTVHRNFKYRLGRITGK
jgi:predicted esterase